MHSVEGGGRGGVAGREREMEEGIATWLWSRHAAVHVCLLVLQSTDCPPPLPTLRGQPCTGRVAIVPCENDTLSIDEQYLTLFAAIRGLRVAMSKTQLTKLISLQLQRVKGEGRERRGSSIIIQIVDS